MATRETALYFVTYSVPPDPKVISLRMAVPSATGYRDMVKAAERVVAAASGSPSAKIVGTVMEGEGKDEIWYDDAP